MIYTKVTVTKTNKSYLFLSYTILIVCTVALFGVAARVYQKTIHDVTLTSNRFLTTEWHLLQELKAKTDRQLRDKDIEISRLRAEYLDLKKREFPPDALYEIETKLRKAEEERAIILSLRLSTVAPAATIPAAGNSSALSLTDAGNLVFPGFAGDEFGTGLRGDGAGMGGDRAEGDDIAYSPGTDISAPITELLGKRIQTLEAEVAVHRLRADMAEKQIESYAQAAASGQPGTPTPQQAAGGQGASTNTVRMVLDLLEQKKAEIAREPPPKIEDIKTRSLLRAIVSSPEIRNEYPGLLEALDRYFTVYGRQEWLTGQKDAYGFMVESIRALESAKPE